MEPKSFKKRIGISDRKRGLLDAFLMRFGVVLGGVGMVFLLFFYWFYYYFVKNDVFDKDRRRRAIQERKRKQNGAKKGAKNDQKRHRNAIKIWIDF